MTETRLSFLTPQGARRTEAATLGGPRRRTVPPPLTAHDVALDGRPAVRLTAADPETGPPRLEAEARAALAVHRAYGDTPYRSLFPAIVGHDLDADEPFLLYEAPRGEGAARLSYGIPTTEQRTVERDLVLAVRLLESVGLVHQGLVPAAVRWDGKHVQVWDLASAVPLGRPRLPTGTPPYAAPEQRRGTGRTDARDALWSAAQIVYQLAAGHPGDPDGPPADLAAYRSLELGDAFAPFAEARPEPARVLARLMPGPDPAALAEARPDPLEPHRQEYDRAMERKRRAAGVVPQDPGSGHGHGSGSGAGSVTGDQQPRRRGWFGGRAY
ncbi:hypothetical protein IAG44_06505 [Streptomyces roseirectus]|uniref:Protein kinase domain-containing protein n=1 Tax=Streptomyces roseirectus TaxID=2768066 RepID=A0A7H0I8L0_9ACTN|nr:hypothetical protein [Streptomyces roseirectus]QNP69126.1 hypothetical protein IAG44_06505 [Streptomyces roseirectus]